LNKTAARPFFCAAQNCQDDSEKYEQRPDCNKQPLSRRMAEIITPVIEDLGF